VVLEHHIMIITILYLKQRFPKLKGKLSDHSNCPEDVRMLSDVMAKNLLEAAPLFESLVRRFMARLNSRLHFFVFFLDLQSSLGTSHAAGHF
jgi:hypothetical protein